jgi:hypothetical protein
VLRHDSIQFYQTLGAKSLSLSFIRMPDLPARGNRSRQITKSSGNRSRQAPNPARGSGPPSPDHASALRARLSATSRTHAHCAPASRHLRAVTASLPLIPIGEAWSHRFAPTRAEASAHLGLIFPSHLVK